MAGAQTPSEPGLRVGVFNFAGAALSNQWVSADGFVAASQGTGVKGYSLFQYLGAWLAGQSFIDLDLRTNTFSSDLLGRVADYSSMSGSVASNNFPTFVAGRNYILTLTLQRLDANSLTFSASWLDTFTGGVLSQSSTNSAETNFTFDGLAIRAESIESTASNIILNELKMDYLPKAINGLTNLSGVMIYYTLDGSAPTTSSVLYTGPVQLTTASVVRAQAFATGWAPSAAALAYYGFAPVTTNPQLSRTVDASSPTAPVVTLTMTPGTGASCVTVTESLPPGMAATNVTAGGNYIAGLNKVLWGPFVGTNSSALSYVAVGAPGVYPVRASWSVDGMGGTEAGGTNIVIGGSSVPTPPPLVATPAFAPPSGGNVPVNVTIACTTAGASIYYTLDGSLPTTSSQLYTGALYLASSSTVRAAAFRNGWTPSSAAVAYYGFSEATANAQVSRSIDTTVPGIPVVTLSVTPGAAASCIAVTEQLPPGLSATSVSSAGSYIDSNNVVLWGPFFGTNALVLSYAAVGRPGAYPVEATWSVDGVGGSEVNGTNIVIGGSSVIAPPTQEMIPTLSPATASSLPVTVSISSSDLQARIYYTTDGSLPTEDSGLYIGPLTIGVPTTLRAVAFRSNYLPSPSAVGYYVAAPPTNSILLVRSVSGNGTVIPVVTISAAPLGNVGCYAVTETVVPGLIPYLLTPNGFWNPTNNTIYWGPFLDNQPRVLTYELTGPSGIFALTGQGSFDGYSAGVTGAAAATINNAYTGPGTNIQACATIPIPYFVDIEPAPGIIVVDSATGTVDWGDGTQSAITQPVMTLSKLYLAPGSFTISLSVNWIGHTAVSTAIGNGTKADTIQVYSSCNPVITNEPTNQVVFVGAEAQFSVGASSQFPLSYQWYFDQVNAISGATATTLFLPNVGVDATGPYIAVVSNPYGSVTSSLATLTVIAPLFTNVLRSANGSVTLRFVNLPNTSSRIWATTNLAPPVVWQVISTNISDANGQGQFTDTNTPALPGRFYRFSSP